MIQWDFIFRNFRILFILKVINRRIIFKDHFLINLVWRNYCLISCWIVFQIRIALGLWIFIRNNLVLSSIYIYKKHFLFLFLNLFKIIKNFKFFLKVYIFKVFNVLLFCESLLFFFIIQQFPPKNFLISVCKLNLIAGWIIIIWKNLILRVFSAPKNFFYFRNNLLNGDPHPRQILCNQIKNRNYNWC